MRVGAIDLLGGALVGLGATLMMDIWNTFLKPTFGIASLNYCMLGRWVRHLPSGVMRHASIAGSRSMPHECTVGWMAHYSIGAMLAVTFVVIGPREWLAQPTFLPALIFGVVTVVFPFFVLQPSLGFGIAGSRTPKPAQARLKSLVTHVVFGLGLYVCALAGTLLPGIPW
ncbi:MAG: DUF2938 family protein [Gemmatimonadota bacterium]